MWKFTKNLCRIIFLANFDQKFWLNLLDIYMIRFDENFMLNICEDLENLLAQNLFSLTE